MLLGKSRPLLMANKSRTELPGGRWHTALRRKLLEEVSFGHSQSSF